MIELLIACLKFAFKRPLLCYLKPLNIIRVIFSEIILSSSIERGNLLHKVDEEDFTTVFAPIAITSDFIK